MRKFLVLSFLFSTSLLAQTVIPDDCPPDQRAKLEAQILAEQVMNRENNTCPKRTYPDHIGDVKTMADFKKIVEQKITELGLTVDWDAGTGIRSDWQTFTEEDMSNFLAIKQMANTMIYALSRYPKDAFPKMGVKKVKFVKGLTIRPEGVDPQNRIAMPEPKTFSILYSPTKNFFCQATLERTLHHELFHQMEGIAHKNMFFRDKDWQKFNPPGFQYGAGGFMSYTVSEYKNEEHPKVGFATEYCTLGEEEDRSEVFSMMMTEGFAARFEGWATVDPTLKAKRAYIQDFLKKKISPSLNEAFFSRVIDPE